MKKESFVQHKKFTIKPVSDQLENTKWAPKATIYRNTGEQMIEGTLEWEGQFDTEEGSDEYAIKQAKHWIDREFWSPFEDSN